MKFAVSIGTYSLLNFARLNLSYVRRVFGDETPVIVYDGRSDNSEAIEKLANEYGAAYLGERLNRGHFVGCQQNSVTAVAFAKSVGADIAVKLNQRLILLDGSIPDRIRDVFSNTKIDLALPGQCRAETIIDEKSKFHSRFRVMPDCIFMRASALDPHWMAADYENQWRTGIHKYDVFTETWWIRATDGPYKERHVKLPWLTEHEPGKPKLYLRKVQCTESEFNHAAIAAGLPAGQFFTQEWQEIKKGNYKPSPRA